jgi:hypothetical protein
MEKEKCKWDGRFTEGKCFAIHCSSDRACGSRNKDGSPKYQQKFETRIARDIK